MTTLYWWFGAVGVMVALGVPSSWTHEQTLIIMFSIAIPTAIDSVLEKQ